MARRRLHREMQPKGGIMLKDSAELTIRYEGQVHQLDVDTLLVSLLNFSEMTRLIAESIDPDATIKIYISAPEKGSFKIVLDFLREQDPGLFIAAVQLVPQLLQCALNFLQLKRLLKGEKPDRVEPKGGFVTIIKGDAQITIAENVYNIYRSNQPVNEALSKMFDGLTDNPEVEGLELVAPKIGSFRVSSTEFAGMARKNSLLEEQEVSEVKERVVLTVLAVVFQSNRKWEFIYEGNKISASIEDQGFLDSVEKRRIRFGKGDRLVVNLEILKVYDESTKCYLNKSYKIVKVLDYDQGEQFIQLKLSEN